MLGNTTILIGHLAHEVKPNYTSGGKAIATVTLYVPIPKRTQEGKREHTPINITVWDKDAEKLTAMTTIGTHVSFSCYAKQSIQEINGINIHGIELISKEFTVHDSRAEVEAARIKHATT